MECKSPETQWSERALLRPALHSKTKLSDTRLIVMSERSLYTHVEGDEVRARIPFDAGGRIGLLREPDAIRRVGIGDVGVSGEIGVHCHHKRIPEFQVYFRSRPKLDSDLR